MKLIKIFLPGAFEDAFLYMGQLLALTRARSFVFYDIDRLIATLSASFSEPILSYCFSRNDWLFSGQFSTLLKDQQIAAFLDAYVDRMPSVMELSQRQLASIGSFGEGAEVNGTILDIQVYCRRLYVSATDGFYHVDIDWEDPSNISAPVKRHDARSICSTSAYGAVNVSCGDLGLFTAYDEFEWSGVGGRHDFSLTADRSMRSAWFSHDLINYPTVGTSVLLRTKEKKTKGIGAEKESRVISTIGTETFDLTERVQRTLGSELGRDTIRVMGNSSRHVFVCTQAGRLLIASLGSLRDPAAVTFRGSYDLAAPSVLSLHSSKRGMVLETEAGIYLFSAGQLQPVIEGGVLTVRTFPRSKRYKNLIVITTESGIYLVSPWSSEPVD